MTSTSASHTTSKPNASMPLRASLQGLPRELRDKIYEHLAATEERIVLGRRFTPPWLHANYNSICDDAPDAFIPALALHPLGITCHQMREEFQPFHASAFEAPWVFLVNNFNIKQLETFGRYFQSDNYFKACVNAWWAPGIPKLMMRFQMDRDAVRSASELCQYVRAQKYSFPLVDDLEYFENEEETFIMQYTPRVRTLAHGKRDSAMLLDEAKCIKFLFKKLQKEAIAYGDVPGFSNPTFRELAKHWLLPFCNVVQDMEKTLKAPN